MNLLPAPRSLKRLAGNFILPRRAQFYLDESLGVGESRIALERLQNWNDGLRPGATSLSFSRTSNRQSANIACLKHHSISSPAEYYALHVTRNGVRIEFGDSGGLRAGVATLRQLLRQFGRHLPCLTIRDWPDFSRRGVMLDISRGRVPKLETLLDLVERLADFKINEFQLYTEHTFAYRNYKSAWRNWGALTAAEIRKLDARCRELGIDVVPNQNSFGHLRYLLEHPKLKKLAEVSKPYEGSTGDFLRYPTTLAPNHPGTIKLLRGLYDELLPNFSSRQFNVGCDETWDLGRGQSRLLCERHGKGRVYVDFLEKIHREVRQRGRRMMFWGDIILNYPGLIKQLPRDAIALNWGYEANHPFAKEAATFAKSGMQFYVCPGTSTWMSLLGRHDNAFANLRLAALAGRQHEAVGFLNCDWGDGGHPQPLAVSWPLYLAGAALSWCAKSFKQELLGPVLSRDVYQDPSGRIARAALALGVAYRKFGYTEANITPFGAVIAAPEPHTRELFCRSGLKLYARIPAVRIRAALAEAVKQRKKLTAAKPDTTIGLVLQHELKMATRMAEQSCHIMLWQQALAANDRVTASKLARTGIAELRALDWEFTTYWSTRNKATPAKCSAFLQWRINDYRQGKLHFPPELARFVGKKLYAAE